MVLLLLRFIRGFVDFRVSGRFPERFINLLNRRGLSYWDIFPSKTGFNGKMYARDYRKIRPLAKKSEVKLRLLKKNGLPFVLKKYKNRRGLALGAVLGIALMLFLGQFIWDVKVDGISRIGENEMYTALADCGVKAGAFKAGLDTEAVERKIMLKIPETRWISINAVNNIAQVQIKEKAPKPKAEIRSYPCNIKAEYDGVITKTVVYSGVSKVMKGSAVVKNQLLVSAVVQTSDDKLSYVHSSADIYADIFLSKNIKLNKNIEALIPKENYTEKSELNFLWFRLPLRLSSSGSGIHADSFRTFCPLLNGVNLPISERVGKRYCFEREKLTLSRASAEKILRKKLALFECFSHEKSKIKSRSYKILESRGGFTLKADYTLNRNIAVRQRINVEQ